ncbi:MAG: hypothetical protein R3Y21_04040 [Mycoplasmatota bacterium]
MSKTSVREKILKLKNEIQTLDNETSKKISSHVTENSRKLLEEERDRLLKRERLLRLYYDEILNEIINQSTLDDLQTLYQDHVNNIIFSTSSIEAYKREVQLSEERALGFLGTTADLDETVIAMDAYLLTAKDDPINKWELKNFMDVVNAYYNNKEDYEYAIEYLKSQEYFEWIELIEKMISLFDNKTFVINDINEAINNIGSTGFQSSELGKILKDFCYYARKDTNSNIIDWDSLFEQNPRYENLSSNEIYLGTEMFRLKKFIESYPALGNMQVKGVPFSEEISKLKLFNYQEIIRERRKNVEEPLKERENNKTKLSELEVEKQLEIETAKSQGNDIEEVRKVVKARLRVPSVDFSNGQSIIEYITYMTKVANNYDENLFQNYNNMILDIRKIPDEISSFESKINNVKETKENILSLLAKLEEIHPTLAPLHEVVQVVSCELNSLKERLQKAKEMETKGVFGLGTSSKKLKEKETLLAQINEEILAVQKKSDEASEKHGIACDLWWKVQADLKEILRNDIMENRVNPFFDMPRDIDFVKKSCCDCSDWIIFYLESDIKTSKRQAAELQNLINEFYQKNIDFFNAAGIKENEIINEENFYNKHRKMKNPNLSNLSFEEEDIDYMKSFQLSPDDDLNGIALDEEVAHIRR